MAATLSLPPVDRAQTICLNMIVKNEAHVIRRCLQSVKPWIDSWVIVDTGSTDGTQDVIREEMAGIPGELHERPWVNFGHNRTEAIRLAEAKADYLFFIDADEEFTAPEGWKWPSLTADAYHVTRHLYDIVYDRELLVSTKRKWEYIGAMQEYLKYPEVCGMPSKLDGPVIIVRQDGARSKDPNTTQNDINLLEKSLADSRMPSRDTFYLANLCRWKDPKKAYENYQKRIEMGGWIEEITYSLLQSALLAERMGGNHIQIMASWLRAYQHSPLRPEIAVGAAKYFRLKEEYNLAYLFANAAKDILDTKYTLFVEPESYLWRNWDEYSMACYYTGRYQESYDACRLLLTGGSLPAQEEERVRENMGFAMAKLVESGIFVDGHGA